MTDKDVHFHPGEWRGFYSRAIEQAPIAQP
jgi:hypothetical protein